MAVMGNLGEDTVIQLVYNSIVGTYSPKLCFTISERQIEVKERHKDVRKVYLELHAFNICCSVDNDDMVGWHHKSELKMNELDIWVS